MNAILHSTIGNNKFTTEEIKKIVLNRNIPILHTIGFKFKNPTVRQIKITYEEFVQRIEHNSLYDLKVACLNGEIVYDFNEYTANDMY